MSERIAPGHSAQEVVQKIFPEDGLKLLRRERLRQRVPLLIVSAISILSLGVYLISHH